MNRGDLIQFTPVVVFFVILAGMLSVVSIPVNIEIYGTVTDDVGNPLDHVYMYMYSGNASHGTLVADGGVDVQGHFSLFIHQYGEFEVWAVMQSGYWAEFQKVRFDSQENHIRQEMNFQLIPNIPCNVTFIASYWSVNSTHNLVSFGYDQTGPIATLVKGVYLNEPCDSTFIYGSSGTMIWSGGADWGGFGHFKQCSISGAYSSTLGEVISLNILENAGSGGVDGPVPAMDYLSPENASGGWIEVVMPGNYRGVRVDVDYNYTLPDALSIPVDVEILGEKYQTVLSCTMLDPGPGKLSVWVGVKNIDSVPHSYKFFVEGGHIIHIWEIS